ncbi:MAG: MOSC domain-containing protein, partial [Actinobacteria bacterium]|nr:MOSC domain-containing protein [Actinomycetota bacterium]
GDAHSGKWHRQVSLLSKESINKMRKKGFNISSGSFAENITTEGIDLLKISIGNRLKIGNDVILEVSQKGKVCPRPCSIYYKIGDCIMPKEGIFAKVIKPGKVKAGDIIVVEE